jgi:hypothetical protein
MSVNKEDLINLRENVAEYRSIICVVCWLYYQLTACPVKLLSLSGKVLKRNCTEFSAANLIKEVFPMYFTILFVQHTTNGAMCILGRW